MQSQLMIFPKCFVTYIACKNFHLSMSISNVLVFALIRWKRFFTNFTFEFILQLINSCFHFERQTNTKPNESKNYYLIASYNFLMLIFKILCIYLLSIFQYFDFTNIFFFRWNHFQQSGLASKYNMPMPTRICWRSLSNSKESLHS